MHTREIIKIDVILIIYLIKIKKKKKKKEHCCIELMYT